ncbi:MAG: sulfurtransferase TusA family protein [Smithella sp.]
MQADKSIDCFGLMCPMPIIKTAQTVKGMKIGQVLEVVATDKGIKQDMPAWCKTTGNECISIEDKGEEIKVYVKKTRE